MQIIYKKTAIDDLLNTENYIISRFNNKQAAQKLKSTLVNTIALLKDNPYLGPKMSDRFNVDTPLRYFVISKMIISRLSEYLIQGKITYHYYFNCGKSSWTYDQKSP